ncbi:hypothetical protein DPMN_087605 [Dreissena polymorpha]|uniref:Uncharacterized protein n=1 Tax=Dreissena polymorpha TaxID=45954 RepID=A0A9D4QVN2_DREPO|nr:hypothetical protein DPMN_087605 [Dreissena polymorpha]
MQWCCCSRQILSPSPFPYRVASFFLPSQSTFSISPGLQQTSAWHATVTYTPCGRRNAGSAHVARTVSSLAMVRGTF